MDSRWLQNETEIHCFQPGNPALVCFMALEDFRRFFVYEEVTCTVLDKRVVLDERRSLGRPPGQGRLSSTTVYNEPMVAVRYFVENCEIITAGSSRPTMMLSPFDKYVRYGSWPNTKEGTPIHAATIHSARRYLFWSVVSP
ncbi:MAG: hypothetical protein ACOWYE_13785 [Desulfatiglandales bacterium]